MSIIGLNIRLGEFNPGIAGVSRLQNFVGGVLSGIGLDYFIVGWTKSVVISTDFEIQESTFIRGESQFIDILEINCR